MSASATSTTLCFADGEVLRLDNTSSQATIFEQAKAAGISLAHDCLNGTCGTCKAKLRGGTVAYAIDRSHLALAEDSDEDVLVCQARSVTEILEVSLPYTRASLLPERKRKVSITSLKKLCPSVWEVRCKAEGARMFPFLAGQYIRVAPVGADFERVYSPSSVPGSAELQFLIRELEGGRMSAYLSRTAKLGDVWQVSGPYGVFYRRHINAPALYVAGGTGLAPILSMLREQQSRSELSAPIKLVFGVTRNEDLFYVNEIAQLQQEMPRLHARICVMTGSSEGDIQTGTVIDAIDPDDVHQLGAEGRAYLCGPPGMLAAVRSRLTDLGLSSDYIFAEEFLPTQKQP